MSHIEAIDPRALDVLRRLMRSDLLRAFCLGGGTGLALQIGHRQSVDLDLFTPEPFDSLSLARELSAVESSPIIVIMSAANSLQVRLADVRVDLLRFAVPLLELPLVFDEIRVLAVPDISAIELLSAVAGRGSKRDYFDIARLIEIYGLDQLFEWFSLKFPDLDPIPVRSLTYFTDAETEPPPKMLVPLTWTRAKRIILGAVYRIEKTGKWAD
jgi:hypothetical protein